jgi:hypothetical protein
MYIGVDWETGKSILGFYTDISIPNIMTSSFFLMYSHVLETFCDFGRSVRASVGGIAIAVGQLLARFRPKQQCRLAIANGAAHPDKGWTVTARPSLCEPRQTQAEKFCRFAGF